MEMLAITFRYPLTPIKEHTPRRISNRLGEMAVSNHVAWLELLGNNCVKTSIGEKVYGQFLRENQDVGRRQYLPALPKQPSLYTTVCSRIAYATNHGGVSQV